MREYKKRSEALLKRIYHTPPPSHDHEGEIVYDEDGFPYYQ
jgi:hypothetical protein